MFECPIPLVLPLRSVVLTRPDAQPPGWLEHAHQVSLRRLQRVDPVPDDRVELDQHLREVEHLKQQRDGWKRGFMELQRAINNSEARNNEMLTELREAAVELGHAIASKLVFQQLAEDEFPIKRLVTEVLSRLNTHEVTTVRLHPADLAVLQEGDNFNPSSIADTNIKLVPDPSLSRGDCKAVAGEITVIYELHRQIEEIRRELLSTVNGHAEPGP